MPLTLPTVHMNGTSREALVRDYEKALHAIQDAIAALCDTAPNGRDYYPQGPTACGQAQDEHRARIDHLRIVRDELTEILIALTTLEN